MKVKNLIVLLLMILSLPVMGESFESRCREFNRFYGNEGEATGLYGVFRQLARQSAELPLEEEGMQNVFDVIKSNHDCNDFTLNGLLRMLYLDRSKGNNGVITTDMKGKAEERILDFKYWWDDARRDTTYRCYHTENHQALYHTAELLAGQRYKKQKFADGKTGKQHMAHALERLRPWLDYRFRFGFSEWLSTYYDVEALLLTNLYDFAEDKEIRRKAGNVLSLLLFDIALNSHNGRLCGASGRTYASSLIEGDHNTSSLAWLAFGVGTNRRKQLAGAIALASSGYRCPEVIVDIARDPKPDYTSLQRTSINVEDAADYGLDTNDELTTHLFWGMQEFIHPDVVKMSKSISERHDAWPYRDYDRYIAQYEKEREAGVMPISRDRFALSEANIVTRRTPHYVLSSLLDYRKGRPGYQHQPWQLTLSDSALIYTNHPGGKNLRFSPNYWAGNEILPRTAQHGSVAVAIYNIPAGHNVPFSHAYFPVKEMDEVVIRGNWLFARKGEGYAALYSAVKPELTTDFRGELCDVIAQSPRNVWICEASTASEWPGFHAFVDAHSKASVEVDGTELSYVSPRNGRLSYGWEKPFTVDGRTMPLRHKCRYDNPYCKAGFDPQRIDIACGDKSVSLLR